MNINYNYYNKQILINQLVEQTKFNIARLTSLENIVNKLNSIDTNTLVKTIDKEVNGYKLLSNSNIKDIVLSDNQATFNNVIKGDYMFNCPGISIIDLPNAEFDNLVSCNYMFTTLDRRDVS